MDDVVGWQPTREDYGRVLASLIRQFRDIEIAEDAMQDAVVTALDRWTTDTVPDNPAAWLLQTARRKAIDRLRRESRWQEKSEQLRVQNDEECDEPDLLPNEIPDERLRLIFTCCHPSLEQSAQVALTLKTLCGLSTAEIANGFLVSEPTMAQRLVRAKSKIRRAGIPYRVPSAEVLAERLSSVLSVIYLIFNEGYFRSSGEKVIGTDLCDEAIFLGKMLVGLMSQNAEVIGLLALMKFHHSRRDARENSDGELVDLEHQDRGQWDQTDIVEADRLLQHALRLGAPGPYQIQAAISALHCNAESFNTTDWKQVVLLYRTLLRYEPGPVAELNLAVALSFAEGPDIALNYLNSISDVNTLQGYHPLHTARASMLARLGEYDEARRSYRTAISLCTNQSERNHLRQRMAAIAPPG